MHTTKLITRKCQYAENLTSALGDIHVTTNIHVQMSQ